VLHACVTDSVYFPLTDKRHRSLIPCLIYCVSVDNCSSIRRFQFRCHRFAIVRFVFGAEPVITLLTVFIFQDKTDDCHVAVLRCIITAVQVNTCHMVSVWSWV